MDVEKKIQLIERNTAEILTHDELKKLLNEKKTPVAYHGFEPTGGVIHVGYMVGINKLIDFQKAGLKVITLWADLHAWLNEKGSLEKLQKIAKLYNLCFAALGLDIKKTKQVLGSTFQLKGEYMKDILKLSLRTRTLRARRAMDVIGRDDENPHVAQMLYPLMQAADIKHLGVDVAFGDLAQRKIHMLAREELPKLGHASPVSVHHEDVLGLTGEKMSSSIPDSMIAINEDLESIKRKINKAFCPAGVADEKNPVFSLLRLVIFPKIKSFRIERPKKFGGDIEFTDIKKLSDAYTKKEIHPQDLKNSVAKYLIDILKPTRTYLAKQSTKKLIEEIKKM